MKDIEESIARIIIWFYLHLFILKFFFNCLGKNDNDKGGIAKNLAIHNLFMRVGFTLPTCLTMLIKDFYLLLFVAFLWLHDIYPS